MANLRKKPTNVSVDPDLLSKARAMDINLSRALEDKLVELIGHEARENWLRQNRAAIDAYNARIAKGPILSDDGPLF